MLVVRWTESNCKVRSDHIPILEVHSNIKFQVNSGSSENLAYCVNGMVHRDATSHTEYIRIHVRSLLSVVTSMILSQQTQLSYPEPASQAFH